MKPRKEQVKNSKILERVLSRKITEYLLSNNLISEAQHGFLKRRSTCTNLLQCTDDWSLSTELGFQTVVVYIDFAKAFDTVSHSKLLHKLYYCGIRGILLSWFKCFLDSHTHQTKVKSSLSYIADLISGIVQDSGIGPLFFFIFINDFIAVLEQYSVKVKLFADNLKLYLRIVNVCDIDKLPLTLNAITD